MAPDKDALEEARVEAVKSANEVINGISDLFILKDLDLLVMNHLFLSKEETIYDMCEAWKIKDIRKTSFYYGGGLAFSGIILGTIGMLAALPALATVSTFARVIHLRKELSSFASLKSTHRAITSILKYLVLQEQVDGNQKNILPNITAKYHALKYIQSRNALSGPEFLSMIVAIDHKLGFYTMLEDVIDSVLSYAIDVAETPLSSLPYNSAEIIEKENHKPDLDEAAGSSPLHHEGDKHSFLENPPEDSVRDNALGDAEEFSALLSKVEQDQDESKASAPAATDEPPKTKPASPSSPAPEKPVTPPAVPDIAAETLADAHEKTDEGEVSSASNVEKPSLLSDEDDTSEDGDQEDLPSDELDMDSLEDAFDIPAIEKGAQDDDQEGDGELPVSLEDLEDLKHLGLQ